MEDSEDSQVDRRFNHLFQSAYGQEKVNLYSSDATPRDKALCYLATAVLAAQTTLAIARVELLGHVFVLTTGIIFGYFVWRKKR